MFNLFNKENFELMVNTVWEKVKAAIPTRVSQLEDDTDRGMKGATEETGGTAGTVPPPAAGKQNAFLRGDGTWVTPATNLLGTVPGIPLDQTMGKQLKGEIDAVSGNLSNIHPAPTGEAQQVTLINNTYTADMDCYLQVNFTNGANSRMSCWVQTDCLWISQTTYTWETIHLAVPLNAGKTAKISQDGDNTNGYTVVKIPM